MYGGGGGAGGYPPPQGGGYGSGYPQQQSGGGGSYPGYPPQQPQQNPPYPGYPPTADPAYPPASAGGPIGFNVDPGYPATAQPFYQPNLGGGGGGGSSALYPPQNAPYPTSTTANAPYPPSSTTANAPYPSYGGSSGYGSAPSAPGAYGGYQQPQQQQQHYGGGFGGGYQQQPLPTQPHQIVGAPPTMATPSIRANPNFNPQTTAELLRKAMKGLGCNNAKVIQAVVNCNNAQRQEVIRVFKQMYGKDLINELKDELRGDFEDLVIALMEHPARYDAAQLRRAMQGLGTKEHVLIEIMTTRTNAQIYEIKRAYGFMFGADLERDMVGETSGYFARLLVSLCSGARDESYQTDPIRANQDAKRLWRAGEARLGTDEAAFNAILCAQNYAQLRLVFDEYQKQHGHPIEQAINAEFSGDIRDAHLALVKSIRNRPAYFAELLYNSMKGFGTRDTDLIRIVVTRSEIDMGDIRQAYQKLYGTPLENAIANDCSGAYKDGLIAIVKGYYH